MQMGTHSYKRLKRAARVETKLDFDGSIEFFYVHIYGYTYRRAVGDARWFRSDSSGRILGEGRYTLWAATKNQRQIARRNHRNAKSNGGEKAIRRDIQRFNRRASKPWYNWWKG